MQEYHFCGSDAIDQCATVAPGGASVVSGSAGTTDVLPGDSSSMAESVTRHALNPVSEEFRFLLCGIDSLDLGHYVDWNPDNWPNHVKYFQEKKEQAFGTNGLLDETINGGKFLHLPSGKAPNYRFHLQFPEYHLYIAISEKARKSPNVYASLTSETLWQLGISPALEILGYEVECFGGTVRIIQPSRCDISVDLLIPGGISFDFLKHHQVSRSRSVTPYFNDGILETIYIGSPSSPVRLRIYDKSKEVQKRGTKLWFIPLWGLEENKDVWRVEFQLRRTVLRQFRINDLHDLWGKIGGVWKYLTDEWFSLRFPDNEKSERRTIHPLWAEVQNCADKLGTAVEVQRTFKGDTPASVEWLVSHINGCITSVAARLGISDRKSVFDQLEERIELYCPETDFQREFFKRRIKLGKNPETDEGDNEE